MADASRSLYTGRKTSSRSRERSPQRVGRFSYIVRVYRLTQKRFNTKSRQSSYRLLYSPAAKRATISVSVGAFSPKSRRITAANCLRVLNTEKSSAGKKLHGKTMRPCELITKGFSNIGYLFLFGVPTKSPANSPECDSAACQH